MTKWALASVVLALVGIACGSSSKGGSDGGSGGTSGKGQTEGGKGGTTVAAACAAYATALCNQINACSKIAIQNRYGTMSDCTASEGEVCTNTLNATQTGDTPSDREACAKSLSTWQCPDFSTS